MDANAPWWVAAALGISTVALAVAGVWNTVRRNQIKRAGEKNEVDAAARKEQTVEQQENQRQAATAAWEVVDRLTKEIERHPVHIKEILETHAIKIKAVEADAQTCREEKNAKEVQLASIRTAVRMILAWIQQQKNAPRIPEEMLRDLIGDGSHTHRPVPSEG